MKHVLLGLLIVLAAVGLLAIGYVVSVALEPRQAVSVAAPTLTAATPLVPTAIPTPIVKSSPTPIPDMAQNRSGAGLSVWATPQAAYLGLYRELATGPLQCTVPPYTDVQVVTRNVGFTFSQLAQVDQSTVKLLAFTTGLPPDTVSKIASVDARCAGYVAAALLTSP